MPTTPEPDWLTKKIEEARLEGRILREGGVRPLPLGVPVGPQVGRKLKQTEKAFQRAFVARARELRWDRIAHFRPVRVQRANGQVYYETPVAEDGAGFLDLEIVRERLVKVELKVRPNKPTPEQLAWLAAYEKAGVEAYVWYPEDWSTIQGVLK